MERITVGALVNRRGFRNSFGDWVPEVTGLTVIDITTIIDECNYPAGCDHMRMKPYRRISAISDGDGFHEGAERFFSIDK